MNKQTFALIGNPNCGKTTLFNALTGSHQHVGNFPGVTIDKKLGHVRCNNANNAGVDIVDLPGIYSLSPYTQEELVARKFVLSDQAQAILNIVDANNLERSLYLTLQLIALNIPIVVALNFIDDIRNKGICIDVSKLSDILGVKVIEVSGKKRENISSLSQSICSSPKSPKCQIRFSKHVDEAIDGICNVINDKNFIKCKRFCASKILENDLDMINSLNLSLADKGKINQIAHNACMSTANNDRDQILTNVMYDYIASIVAQCVTKTKGEEATLTQKIDNIVTNKYWALPIFVLTMFVMFSTTFGPIGNFFTNGLSYIIDEYIVTSVSGVLTTVNSPEWFFDLITEGVIGGVGSVVSFLPQIIILFLFLSILEDTGYLARIAFIMDSILRKIGLSGKSFIPMLMGFGCTTPAVMAARTMENRDDRNMTIMLTPFMSCGAKLPVYALFAGAFFSGNKGAVIFSIYMLGITVAIVIGFLLKKFVFKNVSSNFVLELPEYRLPTFKGTVLNMYERAKDFLVKAGTIIFAMSIVIWIMQNFTFSLQSVQDNQDSILAVLGQFLAPMFIPLGFGTWQCAVAILTGLVAKESVVSTLMVLYGSTVAGDVGVATALHSVFNPITAYAFMTFILLYVPCISAFATIRKEFSSTKLALKVAVMQTTVAYIVAFLVNAVGSAIFLNQYNSIFIVLGAILVILALCIIIKTTAKQISGSGCSMHCMGCTKVCRGREAK